MIESWLFVLAMIAVLMIPGPTNALLASSAHQQGLAKTSLLVPAELFGYFLCHQFMGTPDSSQYTDLALSDRPFTCTQCSLMCSGWLFICGKART